MEGWQGRRIFPPPVGGGTRIRVLLQECPGPPSAIGLGGDSDTSLKSHIWKYFYNHLNEGKLLTFSSYFLIIPLRRKGTSPWDPHSLRMSLG
jgi:hypothetical protein